LQKGITDLPATFLYAKDQDYGNLIIWKNPKPIYNDESFTHLRKRITVRNSNLLLEKDLFKKINKDSLSYEILISKFYYEDERQILINQVYENGVVISIDTTNIPDIFSLNKEYN
jgi:hypothetical protein